LSDALDGSSNVRDARSMDRSEPEPRPTSDAGRGEMGLPIDVKFSNFHCCAEWHLRTLCALCALLYPFALRSSKKSGKFSCSAASVAEFFGVNLRTAQRAFQQLKRVEFFLLLESGKHLFEPSVFRVLTHTEWAEQNPGQCTEKLSYAWTNEGDPLGQALRAASGGQVKFQPFQVRLYRETGIPEAEIITLFNVWYPVQKAEKWGKRWRKGVGFHILMYLRGHVRVANAFAANDLTSLLIPRVPRLG